MLLLPKGFGAKQDVTPKPHSTILGFHMAKGLLFTGIAFMEVTTGPA